MVRDRSVKYWLRLPLHAWAIPEKHAGNVGWGLLAVPHNARATNGSSRVSAMTELAADARTFAMRP